MKSKYLTSLLAMSKLDCFQKPRDLLVIREQNQGKKTLNKKKVFPFRITIVAYLSSLAFLLSIAFIYHTVYTIFCLFHVFCACHGVIFIDNHSIMFYICNELTYLLNK